MSRCDLDIEVKVTKINWDLGIPHLHLGAKYENPALVFRDMRDTLLHK